MPGETARHGFCDACGVTVLFGAFIGWFFGMLIAVTAAANERRRGFVDAERQLLQMQREVERDERRAGWQRT